MQGADRGEGEGLVGAVTAAAFAYVTVEITIETRAVARTALRTALALGVVFHVAERIRRIGDTERGDDGGGDEE